MPTELASFGTVLKAWFGINNWPQSVPERLAKARGNKTGPWASQISHAMKDKHEPKVPFFLALAWFNEQVATRNVAGLTDRRLVDQIKNAEPICHADGQPYGPADFFKLYAGLIDPPAAFAQPEPQLTEEQVQEWSQEIRAAFRQLCLTYMIDRGEAWAMLRDCMIQTANDAGQIPSGADDLDWMQEILAGIREPTLQELTRQIKRWQTSCEETTPLQGAIEKLLSEKKSPSKMLEYERKLPTQMPFQSLRS